MEPLKIMPYAEWLNPADHAPCVISDMPNDVYHACEGISNSGLSKIARSPAHYKYGEFEATKAMELGSALHCAVLEPAVFAEQYLLLPDVKNRTASEYKAATKSRGAGNVLVGKEVDQLTGMVSALNDHYKANQLMGVKGWRELAMFARDPHTGVLCKAKFDFLGFDGHHFYAVDLKTTSDASPEEFSKSIANYRYHVQDAFYSDVFEWATGNTLDKFWFVAVESKRPHGIICRYLDDESREMGGIDARDSLTTYAECVEADYWPCYEQPETDEECVISLPGWKLAQYENDIVDEIT